MTTGLAPVPALAIDALGKTYHVRTTAPLVAIHSLSLCISAGEVLGVLGPPRAGKTTLIKLLAGLIAPTTGQIHIHGHDTAHERLAALRLVSVALHRWSARDGQCSAWEALTTFGQCNAHAVAGRAAHAERLLRDLGMWSQRAAPVYTFDGGVRHALSVGSALVAAPAVLLLDEPTRGMPAAIAQLVEGWIAEWHRTTGTTIVLTTRDLGTAQRLCDRVTLLHAGQLLTDLSAAGLADIVAQGWYHIRVRGVLPADWSAWFDGMRVTPETGGNTLLAGVVPDQAALYGLLLKARNLGLPLLSVTCRAARLEELCSSLWAQGYGGER